VNLQDRAAAAAASARAEAKAKADAEHESQRVQADNRSRELLAEWFTRMQIDEPAQVDWEPLKYTPEGPRPREAGEHSTPAEWMRWFTVVVDGLSFRGDYSWRERKRGGLAGPEESFTLWLNGMGISNLVDLGEALGQ
jgi:hypothetical protein